MYLCVLKTTVPCPLCYSPSKVQVDADTAVVGDQGEINFKEEAKFSQHLKEKAEAVSDFAKSKSLAQQRQYLPIFTVRDDLLQVCIWVCIYHELLLYRDFRLTFLCFKEFTPSVPNYSHFGISRYLDT
jgi:hypothetical protein